MYCTACMLVLLSHYIIRDFWLTVLKMSIKQAFFSFWLSVVSLLRFLVLWIVTVLWKSFKKLGKNKNKWGAIFPKNHENLKSSKPMCAPSSLWTPKPPCVIIIKMHPVRYFPFKVVQMYNGPHLRLLRWQKWLIFEVFIRFGRPVILCFKRFLIVSASIVSEVSPIN